MKKLYFGSNLKMYKGIQETTDYLKKLVEHTKDISREEIELFILPSYTSLPDAVNCADKEYVRLGAQNLCWQDRGQFTGEISPCMLEEIGIDLVMIGHSERRHIFGEDNFEENKKVKAALDHGFKTLLCIGETAVEKEYGIAAEVLKSQLKAGFHDVDISQVNQLWVAYEPVWSIGVNGVAATAEYAQTIHKLIKDTLQKIFGEVGKGIPVLYGGSVNQVNANQFIVQPSIDGLFIGRSAWDADGFHSLICAAKETYIQHNKK